MPIHDWAQGYGLSLSSFARMAQVPEADLEKWEGGTAPLEAAALGRIERVGRILGRLASIMQKSFVPAWLERPNEACKELGAPTPLDLLARRFRAS